MTSTDKSVFTKALELALCCCSEIPVPAAAKAHDAPTRRPNEAERELAAAPAVAPQPAELDAETVANLAAVRERRQKEARARREAERAAQTTLQLAARREAALLSPSENPVLSQTVIPALATLGRTRVTDAEFLAVFKKWRKRQAKLDAAAEKHLQKLVSLASARESEATELVTDNGGVVTAP